MTVYHVLDLLGGLAVFLFGMTMMNSNLTALAGDKLRSIMLLLTKNKFRGYLTGLGITIVNQSSSATTVLEAVLVGAGLMTFQQSLAVTLGSELGSTFLGQLFAFPKITRLATLFVALGFFGYS
jgi:phosphate:Na+ symporter